MISKKREKRSILVGKRCVKCGTEITDKKNVMAVPNIPMKRGRHMKVIRCSNCFSPPRGFKYRGMASAKIYLAPVIKKDEKKIRPPKGGAGTITRKR